MDPDHQHLAGLARARQFTRAYQAHAGTRSQAAYFARYRAESGLRPLSADWVRSYVEPERIRGPLGLALPAPLQRLIHEAWCAGASQSVAA